MVAVQRITSISTLMDSAAVSKDKACVHADFSHALITVLKMTALGRPCCASICANRCASAGGLHIPVVEESISTNLGFRAEGFEHKRGTTSKLCFGSLATPKNDLFMNKKHWGSGFCPEYHVEGCWRLYQKISKTVTVCYSMFRFHGNLKVSWNGGYPQSSSIPPWDFPWHKPSKPFSELGIPPWRAGNPQLDTPLLTHDFHHYHERNP